MLRICHAVRQGSEDMSVIQGLGFRVRNSGFRV